MSVGLLIIGLLLFVGLVVVHEFGHFIMARRNGVEIEEFGIGFPPRLWKKRVKSPKGDYDFTINALPLGGFVKMKGEHDADTKPGTFGAASLGGKVKIMVAGVAMNLVAAFALLTLLALIGIPKLIDNQFTVASDTHTVKQQVFIGYIEPDSPAKSAGLMVRDQLQSIVQVGKPTIEIKDIESFPDITKQLAGQKVLIRYERNGEQHQDLVTLRTNEEVEASKKEAEATHDDNKIKGYLGVAPTEYVIQRSTWSAPIVAGGLIKQFTELTFKGLGNALSNLFRGDTGKASEQVAGPVGIFVLLKDGSLLGYQFILMIIAIISLTLAIMNVLPIPALDGGRLFVTLLFRAVRKPLRPKVEEIIHGTGFALLMLLFILITVVDVKRFF